MESGIYRIYSKITNESYYGSTINFWRRFNEHRSSWKTRKAGNKKLLALYDAYGLDNFFFEILERCDVNDFEEKEKKYIESDKNCLNIWIYPFSPKGTKKTNDKTKGKKIPGRSHPHTEETKKKLREISLKQWAHRDHPFKGKAKSEKTKEKIRKSLKKYYKENPEATIRSPMKEETKKKISQAKILRGR